KYAGVKLAKEHQKADWSRRPLPPAMLAYAAADTAHLPALREQLRARLTALGRLAWAEEEFTHLEELRWTGAPDGGGPDAFLRVKGAKALAPPPSSGSMAGCCAAARPSKPWPGPSPLPAIAPGSPVSGSSGAGKSKRSGTRCSRRLARAVPTRGG